jgi:putative hemolysin
MANVSLEFLIILILLLANGFLALSEIAIVSARSSRLLHRAERGDAGAAVAAELARSPTKFLSTVQVGITLIGILSGAYGGATIAEELAVSFGQYPPLADYAEGVAVAVVVVVLSYLSVIIGELVPKRVALSNPERFAAAVARPMRRLSRLAGPAVAALEHTSNLIIRIFRLPQGTDFSVTEADVSAMVAAGTAAGVFDPVERRIVERTFRLDDEPVAVMMTPRPAIVWLDVNDSPQAREDTMRQYPYSRFPVCDGSLDRVLGIVSVRDVWLAERHAAGTTPDLRALIRQPLFIPEGTAALRLLEQFQSTGTHVAIVIDEHGGVDGLVTLNNILGFLVAPLPGTARPHDDSSIVQRGPNSWLVDGSLALGDFYTAIGIDDHDAADSGAFHTVAGLVLATIGRIPAAGDRIELGPLVVEVVDMDGRRVDKVLVTRRQPNDQPER